MFKYNELSDLKDGTLVTPISQNEEDDTILCITKDGEEIYLDFDAFDFDKTIEERVFIVQDPDSSDDTSEEVNNEIDPDSSDDTSEEIIQNPQIKETSSGWVENPNDKLKILNGKYSYDSLKKVNIWKESVI